MKRDKVIYWATTGIVGAMMLFSAYNYFTAEEVKLGFHHLGFSDSFRIVLGIAKILGAVALLLPFVPYWGKQFAYAGFTITFISAAIAHSSAGDPAKNIITPLVILSILAVSYYYFRKLSDRKRNVVHVSI